MHKISLLILLLFFSFSQASPLLPITDLNAEANVKKGLGFVLLSPPENSINFTLTSYARINEADWMTISYPPTKTYANVSISAESIKNCSLDVKNVDLGMYQCAFELIDNDIKIDFNVEANDQNMIDFQRELKDLCSKSKKNLKLNELNIE